MLHVEGKDQMKHARGAVALDYTPIMVSDSFHFASFVRLRFAR